MYKKIDISCFDWRSNLFLYNQIIKFNLQHKVTVHWRKSCVFIYKNFIISFYHLCVQKKKYILYDRTCVLLGIFFFYNIFHSLTLIVSLCYVRDYFYIEVIFLSKAHTDDLSRVDAIKVDLMENNFFSPIYAESSSYEFQLD
jgi:hypothetical protein